MTIEAGSVRPAWRRLFGVPLTISVAFTVLMVATAVWGDLPIRDPDGFLGPSYIRLPLIVLLMIAADVVPRVLARRRELGGAGAATSHVLRTRWSGPRLAVAVAGLITFYLAYMSYRNLKSFLPFLQEHLTDPMLEDSDKWLAGGNYPGDVLHNLLGTGFSADLLSGVYMLFMVFVPVSLAAALVWSNNLQRGAWYATALSFNWILGTVSYYALPSMGPVYYDAAPFADLPETAVSGLQDSLYENRIEVLADPFATDNVHGIAAFASLHTSIVFTAALVAHLTRLPKVAQWIMWIYVVLTTLATVYFGWHYVLDVVAGLALGAVSVWLAAKAVGAGQAEKEATPDVEPELASAVR
ncbi:MULTISPECIES: phosphatase PAP2 family protein [Arthrobacter]|uniref:Phosphatase PAP2 family protein n=1 Tax=Arthrobacter jinronghuae TaxID=2964609 RepID=A0ABT1NY36_9MICC|nr:MULTISPECIES: phosphatase PAP2 family protein [Arthrobacter]MCQ1951506.1 phosphatase PAP2 family protein [Arthrobacter jinronghuae]MCQ1954464.1 phosphatase PAP2 family protein [Arthrobacter sp. zg-Y238]UWX78856.1 phosphatase PAP2 family protein [Arthrobacter jinronghuae]